MAVILASRRSGRRITAAEEGRTLPKEARSGKARRTPSTEAGAAGRGGLSRNSPEPARGGGSRLRRRLPIGAEAVAGGVHFRVWAPDHQKVDVVLTDETKGTRDQSRSVCLDAEGNGYFSTLVPDAGLGSRYAFRLDGADRLLADPASRFQPDGPEGFSQVIDPRFPWTDRDWRGIGIGGQAIYEVHIGTLTPAGTWRAAIAELPALAALGVTILEVMPIGDFVGDFGWGYDGVDLFAPTRLYGTPDEARAFINAAHGHGLAVILDVVYNHVGPVGNVLPDFAADYFTDAYKTDWGAPPNFDQPGCEGARTFVIANARYWIDEFHFDGLRVDATQNIYDFDETHEHILAAITRAAREAAGKRRIVVIAENEPQDVRLVISPEEGGFGMDAMWNDDFHHAAIVALTGRKEAYYTDYHGNPQEFVSAAKYSFLYQGQRYKWQKKPRGTPTFGLPPAAFVNFLQNHDQIANSGLGQRIHKQTSPGKLRAMTAYTLLLPGTPMLFMGQEFAASAPFLYFADHPPDLAETVDAGRKEFLQQFRSLATPEMQDAMAHPADPQTFHRCKLDPAERDRHGEWVRLHTDLLRLRRQDPVLRRQEPGAIDGACLGQGCFMLRYFGEDEDRLVLVNLDVDLHLDPAPEPLLAPPPAATWDVLWSSEEPAYGGGGTPPIYSARNWLLPGAACVVLRPRPATPRQPAAPRRKTKR
ncbi:MAG: malto-oligosyltrehalose trehalohydrolase [Rhodospirillales bacterium]